MTNKEVLVIINALKETAERCQANFDAIYARLEKLEAELRGKK